MKVNGSLEVNKAVSRADNDIDVRVFGAVGDGSADDTIAIQNAITSLGATGGNIFFPKGTYKITAQISLATKDSLLFKGVGANSIIRVDGITGHGFVFSQSTNIKFKDLKFVGDGIGAGNNHGAINFLIGGNSENPNHSFENIIITDFSDTALQIQGPQVCSFENVILENIGGDGIRVFSGNSVKLSNISVLTCDQAGITLDDIGYASVSDSKMDACGIGYIALNSYGITYKSCSAVNSSNNSLSYPGYGFFADDTKVLLLACSAASSADSHLAIDNGGDFNYINFTDGDTMTTSTSVEGELTASDADFEIFNEVDDTKKLGLDLSAVATATKRIWAVQNVSGTVYVTGGQNVSLADGGTNADNAADARTNLGLAIGTDVQAFSAILSGVVALAGGTGMVSKTGASSFSARTVTGPAAGITVSNGDGVSGNPTIGLGNDLAAVEGLASFGFAVRTDVDTWICRQVLPPAAGITVTNPAGIAGNAQIALANDLAAVEGLAAAGVACRTAADTWAVRAITGTTNQISVTDGNGVSGNPTIAIASNPIIPGTASMTVPVGTIAQRPSGSNGMVRYNSDDNVVEAYVNGSWTPISAVSGLSPGQTYNMGVSLSSGRYKITGWAGGVLSASNIAEVVIPLSTNGRLAKFKLNSDTHYFDDAAAADSDIIGEEFGTTAGVAWGNDRPFFLYFANTDDTDAGVYAFISPSPTLSVTPASGNNIGYRDNVAVTPADTNAFFLTATNATGFTSKPCVCVGSLRMTKNSSDDWTVSALTSFGGIGKFQEGVAFLMPTGQMGATSGKYFGNNGGTAPTYTAENNYFYYISRTGFVDLNFWFQNVAAGTAGSGAQGLQMALPYKMSISGTGNIRTYGQCNITSTGIQTTANVFITGSASVATFEYQNTIGTSVTTITNANQGGASRFCIGNLRMQAFG